MNYILSLNVSPLKYVLLCGIAISVITHRSVVNAFIMTTKQQHQINHHIPIITGTHRKSYFKYDSGYKKMTTMNIRIQNNVDGDLNTSFNYNDDDDEDKVQMMTMNRRKAVLYLVGTAAATTTLAANAMDDTIKKDTLEDITIGKGQWISKVRDTNYLNDSDIAIDTNIPTIFITYMTRFLINYDTTIHNWWHDEILYKYSLLLVGGKNDEYEQQLQSNFSSLAKTVQLALIDYVYGYASTEDGVTSRSFDDEMKIQKRYESLFELISNSYDGGSSNKSEHNGNVDNMNERMDQIVLMFSMLPSKVQPVNGLKSLQAITSASTISSSQTESTFDKNNFAQLLPTELYKATYDSSKKSFTISPPIMNNYFGDYNEREQMFGSISSKPLQRLQPDLSFNVYSLFGLCGATGCALTHTLVIPFDVVKTKLQTDPNQYNNLIDGVISISKEENGLNTFLLGSQATIVGYFWYGLSVYPTYSFTKWFFEHNMFDAASAVVNMSLISLIAGAAAAIVASLGLTPIEAARIRTVAEPGIYRELGLLGTLRKIASEDENLGWKSLYAGFPSLVTRQVIFGSVKFLAFERACEALFDTFPSLHDSTATALGVSFIAGALSGALSSVISQPADSILTYVAKNKVDNASFGVIEGGMMMVEKEGVQSLFRGLGSRCVWASAIISGQFFLYDIFRNLLGINTEDLTQVFQLLLSSD